MESSKPSETQSPTFEADYVNKTGVQNNVVIDLQSEEVRRARWKIDLMMLPLLGVSYFLQFLDKQSLSYSSLLGMIPDTKLQGSQYSWVASIFYFGYIFWSYPTAFLAARLPIGKYLAGTVIVWAIVLMCHGACHNFLGLMITRFFLGAFEAALAPGFSLVMGMWYTRREQPLRYGLWFCGGPVATLFGGLIAYAIGHLEGDLPTWRYLFIILVAVTTAWGIFMLVLLPDSPSDAIWLSSAQRETAAYRIQADTQGSSKGSFKMHQALEALQDPVTWFLCLYTFCTNIANGGLTAFGSLVIRGFGYKGLQALLIQMPTGAAQLGFVVISCTLCSLLPNIRTIMMMCLTIISLIGMVLMYALDSTNQSGRLAGFCLSLAFSANMPLAMCLITSNLAGFTKRAVVNACVLIMYSAGNIVGPQFFNVHDAPNYPKGIKASLIGLALATFWVLCLRIYLTWQNKKRDRNSSEETGAVQRQILLMEDKTDWEVAACRYVL
ncbi:hypothetical protein FOC4_g10000416 [Fusarium odoratissimum]|uniref:Major facilitator superfamily (MFS) profile domain-containing protein n=2 Tax=Fusarium oxysporum f. sp. cubense (strain race 4) TaxID=2502994 RepID=N1S039_FUSC4|nr:uncharacterized protein FOIG_15240 [Fusarium odoratissimum NRRL 54006]EMT72223.1 hypothetical protein FOC4_g10000416 [Fusarium odoratissimum]EXL91588.1 hypothetical protein FOIG_15240 [Fusarium odoratissimum NRRL 54006]